VRIKKSILICLCLGIGVPPLACLCNGISLAACLSLCIPSLFGLLLYLLMPWLWQFCRRMIAAPSSSVPVLTPEQKREAYRRWVDRIINGNIRRNLDKVETTGGLILYLDEGCKANLVTDDFKKLKSNAKMMISHIDDMNARIDELIAILEEP
jgi:hypothetical protein